MKFRVHPRILFVAAGLVFCAVVLVAREHRPSFLRPDLRLNAYVTTADGGVTVVDLVKLAAVAHVWVGPGLSGMREHPTRAEVWGVSAGGGYVWVLDAKNNAVTRIAVGSLPFAVDFSRDGRLAYATASSSDALVAIDCDTRRVVGRAKTGANPVIAHVTPDGKLVLVVNRGDATLGLHDATTLALRQRVSVVPNPEDVVIVPDSSLAFVLSRTERRISVVDLKRAVLLTNLDLAGEPTQMLLKPDGGELYVLSPEAHGLQVINTGTHEVGDYVVIGSAPSRGVLLPDASGMFVSDTAAGRVAPVDIVNRKVMRPIEAGAAPAALAFSPGESPSLLLVANRDSGDISVIRIRPDSQSLLTMIPVGEKPGDVVVKLFSHE
jgi:DNA-binding beta-propeller fold protein YncE